MRTVESLAVIPGRVEDASPESITTVVSMDSGPAPSGASRNDGVWMASSLLAMTVDRGQILRRQHRAADQPALLQIEQRLIGLGKRHRRHRNRSDLLGAHEIEQFLRFAQVADIAALDGDGLDRD